MGRMFVIPNLYHFSKLIVLKINANFLFVFFFFFANNL